jgi:hypothetical protein
MKHFILRIEFPLLNAINMMIWKSALEKDFTSIPFLSIKVNASSAKTMVSFLKSLQAAVVSF